jgi:hypothetical protein
MTRAEGVPKEESVPDVRGHTEAHFRVQRLLISERFFLTNKLQGSVITVTGNSW